MARALIIGSTLAVAVALLAGCGSSSTSSESDQVTQRDAALYQIDQLERAFHKAGSTHNVNLMMSLFAPGAVFNLGLETFSGRSGSSLRPRIRPSRRSITGSPTLRHTRSA
jgi:hypothetical protein